MLDTNVLSELRKPRAERKVLEFIAASPLQQLYISVVSLAEIRFGIELIKRTDVRSAANLAGYRRHHAEVACDAGGWPQDGPTFSQPDLIIAATAAHHGYTVVTRDRSQYDKAHVPVFNPWEST